MNGLAQAQKHYDNELPSVIRLVDWVPVITPRVTDKQVEQFIADLADTGRIDNEIGRSIDLSRTVYAALALDWVDNKSAIPGATYSAFWSWAENAAQVAMFGK